MRKSVCLSLIIATALGTSSIALAKRTATVESAIKQEYPDAKVEAQNTRQVNGVAVHDLRVTTKDGTADAKVTEFGDFVLAGEPRAASNISKDATDTLNGLFKGGQQDVEVYKVTSYLIDTSTGNKSFRLIFDPVGRLHDINNSSAIKNDDIANLEKVSAKDKADKADDYARKYMEGDTVEGVYKTPGSDNFFIVEMKQKDGKSARITLNNVGRVLSQREEIDKSDLPKPVTEAIDQMFDNTKITKAYRAQYEYYQMEKTTNAGQHVRIQVRPNGDVLSVKDMSPNDEANVASHKVKATKSK
jgi:hypothetical protein